MRANCQNSFQFLYLTCILNSEYYLASITETKVRVVSVVEAARVVSVVLFVEDVLSCDGCVAGL